MLCVKTNTVVVSELLKAAVCLLAINLAPLHALNSRPQGWHSELVHNIFTVPKFVMGYRFHVVTEAKHCFDTVGWATGRASGL